MDASDFSSLGVAAEDATSRQPRVVQFALLRLNLRQRRLAPGFAPRRRRYLRERLAQWLPTTLVIIALTGCGRSSPPTTAPKSLAEPQKSASDEVGETAKTVDGQRGVALFTQHCAACHGEKGDGQGIAARFLFPKPRDFRAGRFRLVSTNNGVPVPEDISAVIERGMPGSSMPPWSHLPREDRQLLVERVLALRRDGARDVELQLAAENEEELTEEEIDENIALVTTPGETVEVPELGAPSVEAVARGKELYLTKGCASCHGKEGRGDGQEKMVDAEGLPTAPRDLTLGIFKGNPDAASVYRRIAAGMPGTPMPSSQNLSDHDVGDLVHFVFSLSDEETRAATVMKRETLTAQLMENATVENDGDFWKDVPVVALRTMPLWWRNDPSPWIDVQAVHDGEKLLIRLSWADAEPNTSALRSEDFQDAVAVEIYRGDAEPFLGMGSREEPVDVWMWGAARHGSKDEIEDVNPNIVVDVYPITEAAVSSAEFHREGTQTSEQSEVTLAAVASDNQIAPAPESPKASSLEVGGPGTVTFRPRISQLVQADGQWQDGRWTVVFQRPLVVGDPANGVSVNPGDHVSVAFAVWDGALRDRDGQKRITIWQDLQLAARPMN